MNRPPDGLPEPIRNLLDRVGRARRWRRAERGALRGLFWGGVLAALWILFRAWFDLAEDSDVLLVAAGLLFLPALAAAAWNGLRPIDASGSASLVDRHFGLSDRVASALEFSALPEPGPVAQALVADTARRVAKIEPRGIAPRRPPREASWIAVPILATAALMFVPALPQPSAWSSDPLAATDRRKADEKPADTLARLAKMLANEFLPRNPFETAGKEARKGDAEKGAADPAGESQKDRALRKSGSDFASFLKRGDERLKALERADRLPDLQSDFASSKFRQMAQTMRELTAGKGGQLSAQRLQQLLREMERLGRRNNDIGRDVQEGLDQLAQGDEEGAQQSLEQAMGKLQESEERRRNARRLQAGRDSRPGEQDPSARSDANSSMSAEGERPGFGLDKGTNAKGRPTARLRSTPYDAALESGRRPRGAMVDSGETSKAGEHRGNLQFLGEITQFRRMMEDAISREQVPRDYHGQIRDYFKSLHE